MSSGVIRKITRGTSSGNGDVFIKCEITDPDKIIVILNGDAIGNIYYIYNRGVASMSNTALFLSSVSSTGITVFVRGLIGNQYSISSDIVSFSYQIIEFM